MRVLVLQHIACEPPGAYEDVLRERGATIHRVGLDEGKRLPEPGSFDLIVAVGGPMLDHGRWMFASWLDHSAVVAT